MAPIAKQCFRNAAKIVGYSKLYNFILWFVFGGALLGFTFARLQYLHLDTYAKESAPGEWYYAHTGRGRVGIVLHLATILPCAILVVFQFTPVIRRRWVTFHRINGYIIYILFMVSNASALMIMPHTFGGGLDVQSFTVMLVAACTISVGMAWYNIRRLQIEQHRAWMLRAMFYMGCIVTIRLILVILAVVVSRIQPSRHDVWSCEQIRFTYEQRESFTDVAEVLAQRYPICASATSQNMSSTFTPIEASLLADDVAQKGAALDLSFGSAGWISFFLHLIGVEIYLRLTPREAERLRDVSFERQLAAGYENPGSSGLVIENWGDAKQWNRG
ncbi:hypothetical protein D8B26_008174 [Coccidioides posadasii str. Silveira]|uniref:Uncharacterized protein n=2 Tax=Coccidioides posadasii TaxID=199306 RepID=E9DI06_COCPS|nr:hypothetical protein CPC735_043000 [Coccidioides posadasii C735 delta SOWgp]EER25856.1 hypothetical protein CPC735_043000 [Coccidioides posadasii C735 delta SOWgp]EFW14088.1 conserved hypothetical protein [Coccidioides posadasii str. Silveira]QVM13566.1 hypothetical protein D8B26_008174 [Coccidioides posadasii str. Silveira]|eukprot:XP_003068001.1 hypothetical protein CPC735_043000 [Coccidioides posadasii C735 delta SOWgp]